MRVGNQHPVLRWWQQRARCMPRRCACCAQFVLGHSIGKRACGDRWSRRDCRIPGAKGREGVPQPRVGRPGASTTQGLEGGQVEVGANGVECVVSPQLRAGRGRRVTGPGWGQGEELQADHHSQTPPGWAATAPIPFDSQVAAHPYRREGSVLHRCGAPELRYRWGCCCRTPRRQCPDPYPLARSKSHCPCKRHR